MKFTSLDAITRSVLQQRQLPIHYYLQYLKYAADCFRELHFDTLRVVNARRLPVTEYGAVQLPADYVDFVKVGVEVGQVIRPLHQDDSLNRLYALDANGDPTTYPNAGVDAISGPVSAHTNEYGETIGRFYGFHNGLLQDTFKVLPEKCIIQVNQAMGLKEIVLEYISDGTYADACTKVDPLAQSTIEAYMKWKASPSADREQSPEAKTFFNQLRKLRARKSGLTVEDIKRSIKAATKSVIR